MLLTISPNTRPDYMAKVEEFLGRPFNQDIFVDCTKGVEDQLKERLSDFECFEELPASEEEADSSANDSGADEGSEESSGDDQLPGLECVASLEDGRVEWWDWMGRSPWTKTDAEKTGAKGAGRRAWRKRKLTTLRWMKKGRMTSARLLRGRKKSQVK